MGPRSAFARCPGCSSACPLLGSRIWLFCPTFHSRALDNRPQRLPSTAPPTCVASPDSTASRISRRHIDTGRLTWLVSNLLRSGAWRDNVEASPSQIT